MLTLFTIPNATELLSGVGAYSLPFASDLMPLVYVAGGLALAVGVVVFIIRALRGSV